MIDEESKSDNKIFQTYPIKYHRPYQTSVPHVLVQCCAGRKRSERWLFKINLLWLTMMGFIMPSLHMYCHAHRGALFLDINSVYIQHSFYFFIHQCQSRRTTQHRRKVVIDGVRVKRVSK